MFFSEEVLAAWPEFPAGVDTDVKQVVATKIAEEHVATQDKKSVESARLRQWLNKDSELGLLIN